jgi:hypothetical protein
MTSETWTFRATPIGSPRSIAASYRRRKIGTISSVFGGGSPA